MILSTPLGSREMLPDYGSRISQFYFEPNDQILATLVRNDIHDCVGKYERRISLLDVQIITHESEVLCNLVYKVLASNEVDSYVYPFSRKGLPY